MSAFITLPGLTSSATTAPDADPLFQGITPCRLVARHAATPAWFAVAIIGAAALVAAGGCAAYRFGSASLYPPDIQTVYVPMFQSDSYRRDLAERITEAVCKEVEKRTNYKVVNTPNADSVLSGRLLNDVKRIIVESPTDEPRESQIEFYLEVTWLDRQGALFAQSQKVPLPGTVANINQTGNVVPEVGQSIATGQQDVINHLANQVVNMMEAPW